MMSYVVHHYYTGKAQARLCQDVLAGFTQGNRANYRAKLLLLRSEEMVIVFPPLLISFNPPFCTLHPSFPHPKRKYKQGFWPSHKTGDHLNSFLITPQALIVITSRTQSLRKLELEALVLLTGLHKEAQEKAKDNDLSVLNMLFLRQRIVVSLPELPFNISLLFG